MHITYRWLSHIRIRISASIHRELHAAHYTPHTTLYYQSDWMVAPICVRAASATVGGGRATCIQPVCITDVYRSTDRSIPGDWARVPALPFTLPQVTVRCSIRCLVPHPGVTAVTSLWEKMGKSSQHLTDSIKGEDLVHKISAVYKFQIARSGIVWGWGRHGGPWFWINILHRSRSLASECLGHS